MVQIGLIAVLAIGVAFLLMTRVINRDSGAEEATTTPGAPATGAAPAPTTPATEAPAAPAPTDPAVPPAASEPPTSEFAAGPGLPSKVVDAYEDGDTVVLLITRKGGIDDNAMRKIVDFTSKRENEAAVFELLAREIAKYSRVAQGVEVDRVPAMIVLSPKSVSGDLPVATVSYGFRGPNSVKQAIDDAAYDGKQIPYFPE
jgi:hypothetical protein